jgi:hypothetical protein
MKSKVYVQFLQHVFILLQLKKNIIEKIIISFLKVEIKHF